MLMLAMVVAAASVVVPVGVVLKMALSLMAGVQPQDPPPLVFDQYPTVPHVPPIPMR
jgi:hypothetical protein